MFLNSTVPHGLQFNRTPMLFSVENICRLCFASEPHVGLFLINAKLRQISWEMFGVVISTEHPWKVCAKCINFIDKVAEYRIVVRNTDDQLKSMFPTTPTANFYNEPPQLHASDAQVAMGTNENEVVYANTEILDEDDFEVLRPASALVGALPSMSTPVEEVRKSFQARGTRKLVGVEKSNKAKIILDELKENKHRAETITTVVHKKLYLANFCWICNGKFANVKEVNQHIKSDHPEPLPPRDVCSVCGEKFETSKKLRLHKLSDHAELYA